MEEGLQRGVQVGSSKGRWIGKVRAIEELMGIRGVGEAEMETEECCRRCMGVWFSVTGGSFGV
ncbi:MAG: hypothetical protein NZL93_02800 [Chthoniobacterales bacterium]|nr:hypothetical protein [Chthoniobacterales bacterium]